MRYNNRFTRIAGRLLIATAPWICSTSAQATTSSGYWEAGLGVGMVSGPDYRGSREYRDFISPIPYFVYRNRFIESDRSGMRGRFIQTDRVEANISVSANITPDADKNTRREGMSALGSTLELGPSLVIQLTGDKSRGLSVQLPVRAVFAIGGDDSGFIGGVVNPNVSYRYTFEHWSVGSQLGVIAANARYHDYYYTVSAKDALEDRPHYTSHGGYSGWHAGLSASRAFTLFGENTRLALFVRYDNIDGATFEPSPLVETTSTARGGIAFIWKIK